MTRLRHGALIAATSLFLLSASPAFADRIRVAVASNFHDTAVILASDFRKQTGHEVLLSRGSTGKHYAQITHGAPFDVFLAADSERPRRLELEHRAVPGSRFTYAVGRVVLWSPDSSLVDSNGRVLAAAGFRHLAIANPRVAPYGRAAKQILQRLGVWDGLSQRLVQGENIGQAYQFVKSGNAELGLLAASQVQGLKMGSRWLVPGELYDPIEQQAVLLHDGPAAESFMAFLRSPHARGLIRRAGYGMADAE